MGAPPQVRPVDTSMPVMNLGQEDKMKGEGRGGGNGEGELEEHLGPRQGRWKR